MSALERVEFAVTQEGLQAVDLAIGSRPSSRRFLPTPMASFTVFCGF
jgi:hypothetical protein